MGTRTELRGTVIGMIQIWEEPVSNKGGKPYLYHIPQSVRFNAGIVDNFITSREWATFAATLTTAVLNCRLASNKVKKSKLYYDRQSVGQSVLVSGTHLGLATNFSHSFFDYILDSFGFVDVGRPLWREVWSVLLSFCQASPAQPFSYLSPTALMSIVYCLYFYASNK
jgi:hypothetical protein